MMEVNLQTIDFLRIEFLEMRKIIVLPVDFYRIPGNDGSDSSAGGILGNCVNHVS